MKEGTEVTLKTIDQTLIRLIKSWGGISVASVNFSASLFNSSLPVILSQVTFAGPVDGSFVIATQEDFLQTISTNIIGEDVIDQSMILDCAKELANMVTGNLLTELFGYECAFALEAPMNTIISVGQIDKYGLERLRCYRSGNYHFAFTFCLE